MAISSEKCQTNKTIHSSLTLLQCVFLAKEWWEISEVGFYGLAGPGGVQDKTHGNAPQSVLLLKSLCVQSCRWMDSCIIYDHTCTFQVETWLFLWDLTSVTDLCPGGFMESPPVMWSNDPAAGLSGFIGPVSTWWTGLLDLLCCWTLLDRCQLVLS